MAPQLPHVKDNATFIYKLLGLPVQALTALNIGPFGGSMSVSALIEALLAYRKNETLQFELSKSEAFLFDKMKDMEEVGELQEYREINLEAQEEVIKRWGTRKLGVIWLGGGMVTPHYPLFNHRQDINWHFWTDTHPRVVDTAHELFHKMREAGASAGLSYDVTLPQDIDKLNRIIDFAVRQNIEHLVLQMFGFIYVLTPKENYDWLSKLNLPKNLDVTFIINAPNEKLSTPARFAAATHNQRMMAYSKQDMQALFNATIPGCEFVWEATHENRTFKAWDGWVLHRPAQP